MQPCIISVVYLINWCGFKQHKEYVDLGFRFKREYWNKGFATEAAKGCLKLGFEKLDFTEIVARVLPANLASIAVIEKLGFTFWKLDECNGLENAKYYLLDKSGYYASQTN